MLPFFLIAKTISDAWFQLIYNIFDKTYSQDIQKGSFENEQYRLQYPGIAVYIEHPNIEMVPIFPPALGIPDSNDYGIYRGLFCPLSHESRACRE